MPWDGLVPIFRLSRLDVVPWGSNWLSDLLIGCLRESSYSPFVYGNAIFITNYFPFRERRLSSRIRRHVLHNLFRIIQLGVYLYSMWFEFLHVELILVILPRGWFCLRVFIQHAWNFLRTIIYRRLEIHIFKFVDHYWLSCAIERPLESWSRILCQLIRFIHTGIVEALFDLIIATCTQDA